MHFHCKQLEYFSAFLNQVLRGFGIQLNRDSLGTPPCEPGELKLKRLVRADCRQQHTASLIRTLQEVQLAPVGSLFVARMENCDDFSVREAGRRVVAGRQSKRLTDWLGSSRCCLNTPHQPKSHTLSTVSLCMCVLAHWRIQFSIHQSAIEFFYYYYYHNHH